MSHVASEAVLWRRNICPDWVVMGFQKMAVEVKCRAVGDNCTGKVSMKFSFRFLPDQSKAAGTRGLSRFSSTLKNPSKAKPRVATYAASHALNLEVVPCF